jgi:hypothetical protein
MNDPYHIPEPDCILHDKTSTTVIIAYNTEIFKPSTFLLKRLQRKTGIDYKKIYNEDNNSFRKDPIVYQTIKELGKGAINYGKIYFLSVPTILIPYIMIINRKEIYMEDVEINIGSALNDIINSAISLDELKKKRDEIMDAYIIFKIHIDGYKILCKKSIGPFYSVEFR